jgi:hypothetical protein
LLRGGLFPLDGSDPPATGGLLQVSVLDVPLHWSLKLAFIPVSTIAIALLSYDFRSRDLYGLGLEMEAAHRVIPQLVLSGVRRLKLGKQLISSSKLEHGERAGA